MFSPKVLSIAAAMTLLLPMLAPTASFAQKPGVARGGGGGGGARVGGGGPRFSGGAPAARFGGVSGGGAPAARFGGGSGYRRGFIPGAVAGAVVGGAIGSATDSANAQQARTVMVADRHAAAIQEQKAGNYRRAIGACLDARGYSVR